MRNKNLKTAIIILLSLFLTQSAFAEDLYWYDGKNKIKLSETPETVTIQPKSSQSLSSSGNSLKQSVRSGATDSGSFSESAEEVEVSVLRDGFGQKLIPVGGVIVLFKKEISSITVMNFFQRNGIDSASYRPIEGFSNAYHVDSKPGLDALKVANSLSLQPEVISSSPDFKREHKSR